MEIPQGKPNGTPMVVSQGQGRRAVRIFGQNAASCTAQGATFELKNNLEGEETPSLP
jgi:hypothetical protein